MYQTQEVRPELGFGERYQLRPQGSQVGSNREGKVHRKIKDAVLSEELAGLSVAGVGGRTDDHPVRGKAPADSLNQAGYGKDFSDRDGMNPDHRGISIPAPVRSLCPRGNTSQALK